MTGKRLANRIVKECEDMGAEDVTLIDVRKRTPFFDFMVIATVDNTVLADALLTRIARAVDPGRNTAFCVESRPESDWVACDYGDTVFHVFVGVEVRDRYNLEALWSSTAGRKNRAAFEKLEREGEAD